MSHLSAAFCEEYLQTFSVRLVDSPDLKREAQRLRYQVYCVEKGFEPPNEAGLEADRFDDRAPHALLFHRASGTAIGTVRVVLPDAQCAEASLPIHAVCAADLLSDAALPVRQTAEISRFAISKDRLHTVLARFGDGGIGIGDPRRAVAFACLGLIAAVRRIGLSHGMTHLAAIMRPALLRRLKALGVSFAEFNARVDHHGVRVPCYIEIAALERSLRRERPDLWQVFATAV